MQTANSKDSTISSSISLPNIRSTSNMLDEADQGDDKRTAVEDGAGTTGRGCMWLLDAAYERLWGLLVEPLCEADDDDAALHRKKIFSFASFLFLCADALVIAFSFAVSPTSNDCSVYLGLTALAGLCATVMFYTFCRLQQSCSDLVVVLQFLQTALRQYLFTLFMIPEAAYAGAVGACTASLLYVACRIPPQYHIIPLAISVGIFGCAIADVNYGHGPSAQLCSTTNAVTSFLVSTVILFVFHATVVMTCLSMFLVSFCGDDMKGFFALRMANVVLGLIAALDLDTAARVLEICKHDVTADMHLHFERMVECLQRYKEYLPPSLFRHLTDSDGGSGDQQHNSPLSLLQQSSMAGGTSESAQLWDVNDTDLHRQLPEEQSSGNPLVVPEHNLQLATQRPSSRSVSISMAAQHPEGKAPSLNDTLTGVVIASLFNAEHNNGLSAATLRNVDAVTNRPFDSRRGTVLRISISLSNRRQYDERQAFRQTMSDIVSICQDSKGEIEEATSTFVLVSFGVRFNLVTHEQIAVSCAIRLFHALNDVYKCVFIAVATGQVTHGAFCAASNAFLVVGGFPVDLAAKLNSLQEQIHSPIVLTSETTTRCNNQFLAVDLFRPAGQGATVVYELIAAEMPPNAQDDLQYALQVLQQRGAEGVPLAMERLSIQEDVVGHAKRLLRVLRALPPGAEYCKDEVPWICDPDDIIEPSDVTPMPASTVGNYNNTNPTSLQAQDVMSPPDAGSIAPEYGGSATSMSLSRRPIFSGTRDGASTHTPYDDVVGEDKTFVEEFGGQAWTICSEGTQVGRSCSVFMALGSSGTLAAAVLLRNVTDGMVREVHDACCRLSHPNVARIFGMALNDVTNDNTTDNAIVLLTEYFPAGGTKRYLADYGGMVRPKAWVNFVKDTIRGAHYLNAYGIVHGCIRPSCVLLGEDGRCVLAKYGLRPPHTACKAHFFYAAPELLTRSYDPLLCSSCCDVWSIGITSMELLGYGHPLKALCDHDPVKYVALFTNAAVIGSIGTAGDAPPLRAAAITQADLAERIRSTMTRSPRCVVEFVVQCLVIDKDRRPSIAELMQISDGLIISDDPETSSADLQYVMEDMQN